MEMQNLALLRRVAMALAILAALACGAWGADLRSGGVASAWGSARPIVGGSASLDLFLGLGDLEAASWTEYSLFPYTMGSETLSLSLVRDWLTLSGEYQFSLLPLGITSATLLARARPAPWDIALGDLLLDLSVEGEARLKGDTFTSAPLRTEIWLKAAASVSRSVGCLDQVLLGASLEATASAPGGGRVWPTPVLLASASIGRAMLESATTLSLAPRLRVESETVSLRASWSDLGVSGEAWCTFSEEPGGPSVGLRVSYEFGDIPLGVTPTSSNCSGGVCR
jgi:hypothetical protein